MTAAGVNSAEIDRWNTKAGKVWARYQELLDHEIKSLGDEALRALAPRAGQRILDVGCGCGQTTLDIARLVGGAGLAVGVDVSEPMLAVARQRPLASDTGGVQFLKLDAQVAALGTREFDGAYSRFGVMFFSDPVAAFANIRTALKPGGRLAFVCWRPLEENPLMLAPLEAALPIIGPVAPVNPTAPGPFAFADPGRVRSILQGAGFTHIAINAFDTKVGAATLEGAVTLALRIGPVGAALRENPDLEPLVRDAVLPVVESHMTAQGVCMGVGVWIVTAQTI